MKKLKYYHATKAILKNGQHLSACSSSVIGKNYNMSSDYIYLTTSPHPHFTISGLAEREKWKVYEVIPIGKVSKNWWDDLIVKEVEIVNKVGQIGKKGTGLHKFVSAVGKHRKTVLFKALLSQV